MCGDVARTLYNASGNVKQLIEEATQGLLVTDTQYNARGQVSLVTYANGVTTTYDYDAAAGVQTDGPRGWLWGVKVTQGTTTLLDLAYARDAKGRITAITSLAADQTLSWVYTYNALDRLVAADNLGDNGLDQTFSYNEIGNLVCNSALSAVTCTDSQGQPTGETNITDLANTRPHAPRTVVGETLDRSLSPGKRERDPGNANGNPRVVARGQARPRGAAAPSPGTGRTSPSRSTERSPSWEPVPGRAQARSGEARRRAGEEVDPDLDLPLPRGGP
jgi:hypothetical protein